MKKYLFLLIATLILFTTAAACADVEISYEPDRPRLGDTVDVTVTAEDGAESVIYDLSSGDKHVFAGKEDTHFAAAFRPRREAEYVLKVTVKYDDGSKETASVTIPVSGTADPEAGRDVIYSQKDGSWKDKSYSNSTMDESGCAVFALSHALQRMGYDDDEVLPAALGVTFANCLSVDGTRNGRLITQASEMFSFYTQEDLFEKKADIIDALNNGDMFSFGIAIGHIALVSGISDDGKMVRIVDSAPSATFERIKNTSMYYIDSDGSFRAAKTLEEMPGFRWYFETSSCGGMEYYMDIEYAARRGLRLIRPPWLFRVGEDGEKSALTLKYPGTAYFVVEAGEETEQIPATEVFWETDAPDDKRLAVVNKKSGATLKNSAGKKTARLPACSILPVISLGSKNAKVIYNGKTGFVSLSDVDLTGFVSEIIGSGTITLNGNASGRAEIKIRYAGSSSGKVVDNWKTGTKVTVLDEKNGFCQIEAKGLRVWVQDKYLTLDE